MKIKRTLLLILITIFIMPTLAFADTQGRSISASFDEINIKVNGVSCESDNMVYNDTIYLPIANLSRLLNLSVHYYEPTKTVYIGQIPAGEIPDSIVESWEKQSYEEPKDTIPKGVNSIDAAFNNVTIKVHGEKVNADNISYKNTIFVSLQAVCEILNVSVRYYAPTLTAYVGMVSQNEVPYDTYRNWFSNQHKTLYAEPATGDMVGWQKLRGHEYESVAEIYFKLNGSIQSVQVKDIRNVDLNKTVEWIDDNNIKRYNTVGEIYKLFKCSNTYTTDWFSNKFGSLYGEWLMVSSIDADNIVSDYLEMTGQIYKKSNITLAPDVQFKTIEEKKKDISTEEIIKNIEKYMDKESKYEVKN